MPIPYYKGGNTVNVDELSNEFGMTLQGYLDNPSEVKGTIMNLKLLKDSMNDKYKLSRLKHKKYDIETFKSEDNILYILVGVPSESYKFNYQVMIEMTYVDKSDYVDDLSLRIFSNCPSFIYTYAYVYNTQQLLIPELKNKYSKEVLTKSPEQRNINKITSYEKSIFYAFSYILSEYKNVSDLLKDAKNVKRYHPFDDIKTDEEIIKLYNDKRKEYTKLKKENVIVALSDKLKKERAKLPANRKEKITAKINPNARKQHSVKPKLSGKTKISGKPKTR